MSLIADELGVCIGRLEAHRREILEVQCENYPYPFVPDSKGLNNLANEFDSLEFGISSVVSCFAKFKLKHFNDVAKDAIRDIEDKAKSVSKAAKNAKCGTEKMTFDLEN